MNKKGHVHPFFAQCIFSIIHSVDVVEEGEEVWVRLLFIKFTFPFPVVMMMMGEGCREASFAHFPSVIGRLELVLPLDISEQV